MSLIVAPTTELEAVNEMLTAIGTHPVNTLEVAGLTDAAIARDTLYSINREVQSRGWWFNTSRGVSLQPSNGEIVIPPNMMRVSPARATASSPGEAKQFVVRENKLFDLFTNSNKGFTTPVRADVVYLFRFEDIPESARRYIAIRSARVFQNKVLGDGQLGVYTAEHELEAYQVLEADHVSVAPSTIYIDRMRLRFSSVRPDPVILGRQQQGQQGQ